MSIRKQFSRLFAGCFGLAWLGFAIGEMGKARQGKARQGKARQGSYFFVIPLENVSLLYNWRVIRY